MVKCGLPQAESQWEEQLWQQQILQEAILLIHLQGQSEGTMEPFPEADNPTML